MTVTPSLAASTAKASGPTNMPLKPSTMALSLPHLLSNFSPAPSTTLPSSLLTLLCLPLSPTQSFESTGVPPFFLHTAKQDVISTLSNSSFLLKIVRQSIFDIASTRKRNVRNTFLQALHQNHLLSRYIPVTSADFEQKRFDLQSTKANLLKRGHTDVNDITWWRCASLSALALASPNPNPPYTSPSNLILPPQQQLPDSPDEKKGRLLS